ncbi:DNA-directed RNA polymerase subunit K [Candidatus Woesearchaeota archaeon]|jgi:DNA-directed RNA polymerase subunit K/omega|nr:DNA-directed RNA polymerase subunit K [Candidatus Woesearchaeota archaeon]
MASKKQEPKFKLTKYEKARILGARALQISMGAPFLLKISKKELEDLKYNPIAIAKKEFEADVLPIEVRRPNQE